MLFSFCLFLLLIFYNCFKSEGRSLWPDVTKGIMRTTMAFDRICQRTTPNRKFNTSHLNIKCHSCISCVALPQSLGLHGIYTPAAVLEPGNRWIAFLPFCIKFHPLLISEMIILTLQELWVCMSACKDKCPHSCARLITVTRQPKMQIPENKGWYV